MDNSAQDRRPEQADGEPVPTGRERSAYGLALPALVAAVASGYRVRADGGPPARRERRRLVG